jgi:hypothetical protein
VCKELDYEQQENISSQEKLIAGVTSFDWDKGFSDRVSEPLKVN